MPIADHPLEPAFRGSPFGTPSRTRTDTDTDNSVEYSTTYTKAGSPT